MAKDNKGAAPDMGDLSDVSATYWTVAFFFWTIMIIIYWKNKNNVRLDWTNFYTFCFLT